jgi:hypothetical protein
MLWIDHVIIAVEDLERAANEARAAFGWGTLPGGRHPGGTSNKAIPLGGEQYLEFLTVDKATDQTTADIATRLEAGPYLFTWAVVADDFDCFVNDLGLSLNEGSVTAADGTTGTWRSANVDHPLAPSGALPFILDYGRSRAATWAERYRNAAHQPDRAPRGIAWIEIGVGNEPLPDWLEQTEFDLRVTNAAPGVQAVGIRTEGGGTVEIRTWPPTSTT